MSLSKIKNYILKKDSFEAIKHSARGKGWFFYKKTKYDYSISISVLDYGKIYFIDIGVLYHDIEKEIAKFEDELSKASGLSSTSAEYYRCSVCKHLEIVKMESVNTIFELIDTALDSIEAWLNFCADEYDFKEVPIWATDYEKVVNILRFIIRNNGVSKSILQDVIERKNIYGEPLSYINKFIEWYENKNDK
ncbi:hypothetical protein [Amphritea pacifica]|uniref:DUF4304 domain-containing protein n=1 Tax=Amphritea pacifica TaxID=2811233 RepID=A0ABS2WDS6_9GAMM|nr:hypothetical protein [Amphritea pacifica]MBN0989882.1 hypothetical protein [Amphritea pacifica]